LPSNEADDILAVFKNDEKSPHLSSGLGVLRYVKMADRIKQVISRGKILDWGAGCGQVSFLLKNRGFDVVSYEIAKEKRPLLEKSGQPLIIGSDPVKLPFPDACFDAVLSSGVLEHVQNDAASLGEIRRVLKSGGYFLIFMLPNKYSYIEFISDRLGRGDHPIKYSIPEIKQLLGKSGYTVLSSRYQGFFPYNLKGFPGAVQRLYHRFDRALGQIDALFSRLPLINLFCTNIELVIRKTQ
jgi:SAM-dependent methyltransferase